MRAHKQKHICVYTTNIPVKHCSLKHQGGVVVDPYGAPVLEKFGDLIGGPKNKPTESHSLTGLIDL